MTSGAGVLCLFTGRDEAAVRYSGTTLQLAGLVTVAWGLRDMRRLFDRPSLRSAVVIWVRKLSAALMPARHVVVGAGSIAASGQVFAPSVVVEPGPDATLEERVAALERRTRDLTDELHITSHGLRQRLGGLQRQVTDEHGQRQRADAEISQRIEAVAVGGLRLEVVGLLWLMLGLVCTSVPGELAGAPFVRR